MSTNELVQESGANARFSSHGPTLTGTAIPCDGLTTYTADAQAQVDDLADHYERGSNELRPA